MNNNNNNDNNNSYKNNNNNNNNSISYTPMYNPNILPLRKEIGMSHVFMKKKFNQSLVNIIEKILNDIWLLC